MFCIHCRKKLPDKSEFCPFCGTPVVQETNQNNSSLNEHNNPKEEKIIYVSTKKKELRNHIIGLTIMGAIIIFITLIYGCSHQSNYDAYDKGLSQLENKQYQQAAETLISADEGKDGNDLKTLANAFESFKKGDYDMADYYLNKLNLDSIEARHSSLKNDIEAMKEKLDSTREERKQTRDEKYKKEEAQKKADSQKQAQEYLKTLHIGDPDNKIVDVMGTPKGKNTTQVDGHTMVQWVYDNAYIYTEDGIITAFQKFQ